MDIHEKLVGSYKDPSGYVFMKDSQIFRRVNKCYLDIYRQVRDSGLIQELIDKGLLINHEEVQEDCGEDPYIIIKPRMIGFISYPYEWSFSQLKDAALATLEIQRIAISHGFTLKDAHGFNIQFYRGIPVFIDTLSFDRWDRTPWVAYRQFCESFLVPLALMRYRSPYLNCMLTRFLNGIPLEIGSGLLPMRTKLSISLLMHVHLHAGRKANEGKSADASLKLRLNRGFSKESMLGLCMSLEKAVRNLSLPKIDSVWDDYYQSSCIYSEAAFEQKRQFIDSILQDHRPSIVWDLGCNTGEFSLLSANYSDLVVAIDSDHACVERLYQQCKSEHIANILPLQMDLVNPSPAVGWDLQERMSLHERGGCDLALALALIHHLCISANIPLEYVARFMGRVSRRLIIEFIPKEDPQVQLLLASREDIFTGYNRETFESAFSKYFRILRANELFGTSRIIYHMVRV